jgi:CHAD domain-containing protein
VPPRLESLVRAWVRTATLTPVAHLATLRRRYDLCDGEGAKVGEVDDDEVSVLSGDRVAARFREVEVELAPDAPDDMLDAVVRRLRDAGAGAPDPTPKLVRALGPRALAPPELAPPSLGHRPPAADVVRAGLAAAVRRIVEHDHVVRLDDDPEGVHQARVGTRRLRSDLRTFRTLVDQTWSEPLRDELAWLADELGTVRDLDVLSVRLRRTAEQLDEGDRAALDELFDALASARAAALAGLLDAMDTRRYVELLDRLVDGARSPRLLPDAAAAADEVLPRLAAGAWKRLRRRVRALGATPTDDELHGVRIAVKRARYAADVAVPVAGEAAESFAKALARLQDVLGDHHDAIVAATWVRERTPSLSHGAAFAAGQLVARCHADAEGLRDRWTRAWRAVDTKKATRWLS